MQEMKAEPKREKSDIGIPPQRGSQGRPNLTEDTPVSLAPLSFGEAIAGLLAVQPEPRGEQPKARRPRQEGTVKKRSGRKTDD